jgi:Asp-tRNA(Asn)/Glu-tRNA(Gln) amidotransferase C subunit
MDIVERLRKDARGPALEAADYIEQLRTGNRLHLELAEIKEAEIERLRDSLERIACFCQKQCKMNCAGWIASSALKEK